MRVPKIFQLSLGLLSAVGRAFPSRGTDATRGEKLITFADVFSGNFSISTTIPQWTSQGDDGSYFVTDPTTSDLILENIITGNSTVFVHASAIAAPAQNYHDYWVQPSGRHVLFAANNTKLYRHSFYADYYVFDVTTQATVPLVDGQAGDIQYAGWAPHEDTIAYVRGNNIYIWQNGNSTQITTDGSADIFNGIADWVYEEEIYGDTKELWFSPDGKYLAFLKTDETGVPIYQIPYYMAHGSTAPPYPEYLQIRYPKVGQVNPSVSFHLLNLENLSAEPMKVDIQGASFPSKELIIGEVAWVTDTHSHVILRAFNRVQDQEKYVLVETTYGTASAVRERNATAGWLDNTLAIHYIPGISSYVDLSDESGWNHLYLYPLNSSQPIAITSGDWEVTEILKVVPETRKVYYASTERDSTERHVYSVSLDGTNKTALVDDTKSGYWSASFSNGGGFYILSYNGPDLPYQTLYATNDTSKAIKTIEDNAKLATSLSAYALPNVTWSTLEHPDGFSLNVMERLPPNFDPNKKYPVVFDIYGGPGSQRAAKTFKHVDFRNYLASDPELEYVVLTVDNRGTGFKGREFRSSVTGQLGKLEALDQVFAAREWGKKPYVDASKIAIMGWSFGGYLSSKVLELNSNTFSFAVITAPVSDWRFYDSMYTERYMKSPRTNLAGYLKSAVHNTTGFQNARGGFLLQHGTGDDNVHFQNSAVLIDTLTMAGVSPQKMHVQWFTDSDHSINTRGATPLVYKQMARALWLEKKRQGVEMDFHHQFDRRWDHLADLDD